MKPAIRIVICCLVGAMLLLPIPVSADEAAPTITNVYFEKDGLPYNGSVQYTVKCYGYQTEGGRFPYRTPKPGETQTREMVFSYSATCPGYGCTIYEPYYHVDRKFIDRCDLEGTTDGYSFRIDNFSTQPYTHCGDIPARIVRPWNTGRVAYYTTPEFDTCWKVQENYNRRWSEYITWFSGNEEEAGNSIMVLLLGGTLRLYSTGWTGPVYTNRSDIRMDTGRYIAYLENCNPGKDPFCPGWIVDGVPLKKYTQLRPFMKNETHLAMNPCDSFLVAVDPNAVVPSNEIPDPQCLYSGACNVPNAGHLWEETDIRNTCTTTHCMLAQEYCDARFTIPSGISMPHAELPVLPNAGITTLRGFTLMDQTTHITPKPAPQSVAPVVSDVPLSPVESLYCSIVELLGGKCE